MQWQFCAAGRQWFWG